MRHMNRTFDGTEAQAPKELTRLGAEVRWGVLVSGRVTHGEMLDRQLPMQRLSPFGQTLFTDERWRKRFLRRWQRR